MSFRKMPYLIKTISQCATFSPFQTVTKPKILTDVCARFFSRELIDNKTDSKEQNGNVNWNVKLECKILDNKTDSKEQNGNVNWNVKLECKILDNKIDSKEQNGNVNLLGQLFPQTSLYTPDSKSVKEQQNEFEKESKEKSEENKKSWRKTKIGFGIFGASISIMGGMVVYEMGKPHLDPNGQIIVDEFSHMPTYEQYFKRTWKEMSFYQKMIKEPSREKLLPDPVPAPFQPPYTLVLEFTDVLVHPDWTYQTGWRFKKRPGLDAFLSTMASTSYEVVIFTNENPFVIWPVIEQLDPNHEKITYKLFRDSTHFVDGVHIKNLDYLNRDLSKVIVVDWNTQSTKYHPQNTLKIPKWKGNDDDTTLIDLTALLKMIASSEIEDVREVLNYYSQFDDPIAAFRDNQRRLIEQMDEQERQSKKAPTPMTSKWTKTFLSKS